MKKNNLVVATLIMLVFSIISKFSGFLREVIFAYFYGATNITDAYVASTTISTSIFAGITVGISVGYIPSIAVLQREKLSKTTSNILNIVVFLMILISLVGVLFVNQLIPLYAIDFTPETKDITAEMTRIILPFSFLYASYYLLNGYMQVQNVFWTVGIATIINNAVNMVTFAVSNGNTKILAIGYVLSWVFPSIFLLIVAKFKGFKYTATMDYKDEIIKNIILMGIPVFIGQLVFQLNTIVDKNFASMLGEGIMTIMKYANQLIAFVTTIFVLSIVTAIYPTISKLANDGDLDEYKKISNTSMSTILLLVIPVSTAFVILAPQIVEVVFMRGEFDQNSADITSQVLMAYSLGLPAMSVNELFNKQFYSLKDTKTPVYASAISLIINIVCNLIFMNILKHIGLALATSIANTALAGIMYYKLQKKVGDYGCDKMMKKIGKILFSSAVMGVVVCIIVAILSEFTDGFTGNVLQISISALVGAPIYGFLMYIFKIEEFEIVLEYIKSKIFRKKA